MLTTFWSEAVAESEELFLVDLIQQRSRCPLDDLVLKGRNRKRALSSIRLRNISSPGRKCAVRSPVNPVVQVLDQSIKVRLIGSPRHPIHTGSSISPKCVESRSQCFRVEMVEERSELFLLPLPCGIPYAVQRM